MKKSLADILIGQFGVSEEDYAKAAEEHQESNAGIGDILLEKEVISEKQLLEARSIQYGIPFVPYLPIAHIATGLSRNVTIGFLKKNIMVPMDFNKEEAQGNIPDELRELFEMSDWVIAVNDPVNFQPLDDLVRILKVDDYQMVLATKDAILTAVNMSFENSQDSAEQLVQDMLEDGETVVDEIKVEETADLLDDTSDAPIIQLVNHIISQSIKAGASDIHIEPYQDSFKVRYRVDGILYDMLTPPKNIQGAVTARIKVMARMNIAEKRLPQDGRIEVRKGNQAIDIRVSTIPISFGERVVMRLLNKTSHLLGLTDIGFEPDKLQEIREMITASRGIILVTGPTGSGKTTTLYAILSTINTPDKNIITIEDPVEYQIRGIGQIQVNPKIDLTFARGLRSIMRQDPDVILVGEIRDKDTADIAVQSALTGHLVFSTVHTNDAASAITRLVDLGVEPFLLSSSINAVTAQRLVRVLCPECKEPFTPDETTLKSIGITPEEIGDQVIYRPKGCEKCFNKGYQGRVAICEIMRMKSGLSRLILETYDSNLIREQAMEYGMDTLLQDGIKKVLNGVTSISEILRVTQI